MKNDKITSRDVDFAKWYTDILRAANLIDYSAVKGCSVIEPNGYAIWEKMQEILDKKFKELGHVNVQLPLLIPESLLKKESELVEGFAPEVAWVTHGGQKELEERLLEMHHQDRFQLTLFGGEQSDSELLADAYKKQNLAIGYNRNTNIEQGDEE